jgi:hypothetical protein
MDRWTDLRRQLAHRWETLRPWVTPDPNTRPMKKWKPARREELDPVEGVLKYVDKQTEPQVVKASRKRRLMPGESVEFPRARVRRTVKTIKRR